MKFSGKLPGKMQKGSSGSDPGAETMGRILDYKLIGELRKKILAGGFDKVAFLPSERNLAEEYQVGRGIIRGALKALSEEGLLYKIPGRGFRLKQKTDRRLKRIILRLPIQMSARAYEAMGIVAGICSGANEIFAEIILSTSQAKWDFKELQERYNADDIQGIIFLEGSPDIPYERFISAGIPFVIANLEEEKNLPGVRMDYRGIGRIAGMKLLQEGYRKIAVYTGSTEMFLYREILAGFRGALAEETLIPDESMIITGSRNETPGNLKELLMKPAGERPEAIFTVRDYRAANVYALCEELGLAIPEDLAVISFDGITWPNGEKAGLTTITEEAEEIGRQSVFLLQQQFRNGYDPVRCMVSANLINRSSLKEKAKSEKVIIHKK